MYDTDRHFTIDELCTLFELTKRQVREYIEHGLVDCPCGSNKDTYYTQAHIEQLLSIHKRQESGLSSVRGGGASLGGRRVGNVETWTHLVLDQGVELHVDASLAGFGPDELRAFLQNTTKAYQSIRGKKKLHI